MKLWWFWVNTTGERTSEVSFLFPPIQWQNWHLLCPSIHDLPWMELNGTKGLIPKQKLRVVVREAKSKGDLGPWGEPLALPTPMNSGLEHKAWMWSQEQGSASGPGGDAWPANCVTDWQKMEKQTNSARRLEAGLYHSWPGALLRSKISVMTMTLTSEKPSLWPRWVKVKTRPSVITFALKHKDAVQATGVACTLHSG